MVKFSPTMSLNKLIQGKAMRLFKTIHSKIPMFSLMIAKKKILAKLEVNNLDLETFTLYEFNSLVKNEESIIVCRSRIMGIDIAIGLMLGIWVYILIVL